MVLGLFAGLFGYLGVDIEETWEIDENYTIPSPAALFGIAAIIVGLLTLVTGIFGALAGHYKLPCYTLPFQIFVIIVSVLMLVVAVLGLAIGAMSDDIHKMICKEGEPMTIEGKTYANLEDYM